jgi:threonine/homoserine/homoserine lactone efflux protein
MIWILLKGLAVGVAVAAPVGPIGLLCIKRTLDRGWATGVASGLGVAAADASYGLMVAAGLSATGLLLAYATPMQAAGGLLIAFLGLLSLRAGMSDGPGKAARGASGGGRMTGLGGAFASAYGLTIANPMTILAFAGLVAGLGGAAASNPGAVYVLVVGVFAGSLLWWVLLASATALARTKVTPRITRWLDLGSGAVLLTWGLWIAWTAFPG